MSCVYLCRAIPLAQDSRAQRYYQLIRVVAEVRVIQWGPRHAEALDSATIVAPLPRVRAKPWLNLLLTPLFSLWLFCYLLVKVGREDQVFAIDLDTALPAYLASRIKRFQYFFDIADPYSAGRLRRSWSWVNWLEGKVAEQAKLALIPIDCRRQYYAPQLDFCVIENIPELGAARAAELTQVQMPLRLGYFGALEPGDRLLELLVSVVASRSDTELYLGGSGGLSGYCQRAAGEHRQIHFSGSYIPADLPTLVAPCHVLFAAYSLCKSHHQCIAANKLYEHLQLGRPLVTNAGTNLAAQVLAWGTGWVFEENPQALHELIDQLLAAPEQLEPKALVARARWHRDYQDYWRTAPAVIRLQQALQARCI